MEVSWSIWNFDESKEYFKILQNTSEILHQYFEVKGVALFSLWESSFLMCIFFLLIHFNQQNIAFGYIRSYLWRSSRFIVLRETVSFVDIEYAEHYTDISYWCRGRTSTSTQSTSTNTCTCLDVLVLVLVLLILHVLEYKYTYLYGLV